MRRTDALPKRMALVCLTMQKLDVEQQLVVKPSEDVADHQKLRNWLHIQSTSQPDPQDSAHLLKGLRRTGVRSNSELVQGSKDTTKHMFCDCLLPKLSVMYQLTKTMTMSPLPKYALSMGRLLTFSRDGRWEKKSKLSLVVIALKGVTSISSPVGNLGIQPSFLKTNPKKSVKGGSLTVVSTVPVAFFYCGLRNLIIHQTTCGNWDIYRFNMITHKNMMNKNTILNNGNILETEKSILKIQYI